MSSAADEAELSSNGQLSGYSNTADQDALSTAEDVNDRCEVVEGLELVPVLVKPRWLEFDEANEYVQLCNGMYNSYPEFDCCLPLLLKEFGDPLANSPMYCGCDDEEESTCWLTREFCGTMGKDGRRRRRKLIEALDGAVGALENGLLRMYRNSIRYGRRLIPGLHKVATRRLGLLTHAVERLQEFHKPSMDTSPDELKSSSSTCDGDTRDDDSNDEASDGGNEDLAGLERRLLACKTGLLKPLEGIPNTKQSIIKASEDLNLAVHLYDDPEKGPRLVVRGYYKECVLRVADAVPSLEHYSEHPTCGGLAYDLREIDNGYRKARDEMYIIADSVRDGLGKILWSIWDETRSHFEDSDLPPLVERPDDLCWDSDDELS